jgi:hypothetical protein
MIPRAFAERPCPIHVTATERADGGRRMNPNILEPDWEQELQEAVVLRAARAFPTRRW